MRSIHHFKCKPNQVEKLVLDYMKVPNAALINVPSGMQELRLQLADYDPYQTSSFIFYSYRSVMCTVNIYGLMSWERLEELEGHVNLLSHLKPTFQIPIVPSDNSLFSLSSSSSSRLPSYLDDFTVYPWIPIDFDARSGPLPDGEVDLDLLTQRLNSYLHGTPLPSMSSIQHAQTSKALSGLCKLFPDLRVDGLRFLKSRQTVEKEYIAKLLKPFASREQLMYDLLRNNQLGAYMDEAMCIESTTRDKQAFYHRFGPSSEPPQWAFIVPPEEVPKELLLQLPFHETGFVHLSYRDIPQWICHIFVLQDARHPKPDRSDMLTELVERCIAHFRLPEPPRNFRSYIPRDILNVKVALDAVIDELPQCVGDVLRRAEFPRNSERVSLIRVFKKAGIEPDVLFDWFEAQNQRYPRALNGSETAVARYNYEQGWEALKTAESCETLASKSDGMRCPFANGTSVDIEDLHKQCRPHWKYPFFGPHTVVRNALRGK
jgi:hypothetical protein